MKEKVVRTILPAIFAWGPLSATLLAKESDADALAKASANPVSSLISVPFQYNYDESWGSDDGYRHTLNIRPVIPLSISEDWNNDQWTVPINLMFTKVMHIGSQAVSYQAGVRGYAEAPNNDPDWGLRLAFTLLYPK